MGDFTPYILPAGAAAFALAIVVMAKLSRRSVERRKVEPSPIVHETETPNDEQMEQIRKLGAEFQTLQDALSAVRHSIEEAVREVAGADVVVEREKVNH